MSTASHAPGVNTRARQCIALLELLALAPADTHAIRERLGIASPAARVLDLRRAGHSILTETVTAVDFMGRRHRSASYVLQRGAA